MGLLLHRLEQPAFGLVARLPDQLDGVGADGHPLGDEQREEAAGEADDQGHHHQARVADAVGADPPVEPKGPDHDGDDQEDREVRQGEERDAFHGSGVGR
ncbi:MAG: hypothetical protein LW626_00405, partial [Verrucomicrobium sp.]|nr:hypothetical protein [Verrucomicrobium sp.]